MAYSGGNDSSMASSNDNRLPTLADKVLSNAIHPHLLAYCSRTDLLAVVSLEETVDVYRFGGQRAFSVKKRSQSGKIVGLHWIRDGKCLAIALDTGTIDIVSGETGKLVRHGGDDPFTNNASDKRPKPTSITCLGWGTTLTQGSKSASKTSNQFGKGSAKGGIEDTTEDWYDEQQGDPTAGLLGSDVDGSDALLNDLPYQLASIDIESVLPRLSAIPSRANTGGLYDMFTTQVALDDYFTSLQRSNTQSADVMLAGHQDGLVRLVIDDIIEVTLPHKDGRRASGPSSVPLQHASCLQSPYHALLRADRSDADPTSYRNLSLSLFDIPLLSSGGNHLHLIVSKTAQIRDLCNYITYGVLCVEADWKSFTNLPSRFIENINETLAEKQEGTLEQNLYHLAMTGNFTPTILEWLRDELAERGHKRWDLATSTLHADLSKLFQTNLLPAFDRCIVVATSLRGLATYYEGSKKFNVAPALFTAIIDALCMMQLLVHEAVQILTEEQRQFRAFSKWLRHVIDLAAADPTSISAKDMAEREAHNLDIPPVLAYLEGALTKSKLKPIVFAPAAADQGTRTEPSRGKLVEAIQRARTADDNDDAEASEILSLGRLRNHLIAVCQDAHTQILRWQNSAVPNVETIDLATGPVTGIMDMQMLRTQSVHPPPNTFETLILTVPLDSQNILLLTSILHTSPPSLDLPATTRSQPTQSSLTLPPTFKILASKILHTNVILLVAEGDATGDDQDNQGAWGKAKAHHLIAIPLIFVPSTSTQHPLTHPSLHSATNTQLGKQKIIHSFPPDEAFIPVAITVGPGRQRSSVGRPRRGGRDVGAVDAHAVVVVVGDGGGRWRVLDGEGLVAGVGEEEGEGEGYEFPGDESSIGEQEGSGLG